MPLDHRVSVLRGFEQDLAEIAEHVGAEHPQREPLRALAVDELEIEQRRVVRLLAGRRELERAERRAGLDRAIRGDHAAIVPAAGRAGRDVFRAK